MPGLPLINEFGVKPGPYYLRGEIVVLLDVITHEGLDKLEVPRVLYRPLVAPKEHVDGKPTEQYQRMMMPLDEWKRLEPKEL